jgi:hypothetical protein
MIDMRDSGKYSSKQAHCRTRHKMRAIMARTGGAE